MPCIGRGEAERHEKTFKNFEGNARAPLWIILNQQTGVGGSGADRCVTQRHARLWRQSARSASGRAAPASRCSSSLNYEEGGENSMLHGDAASEAFLSEIVGAQPVAGSAPLEHGIDLRIWRARRLLAAAPHLHRGRSAGHRLWRGNGARPLARPGRGDAGSRLGDRLAWAEMDRLPRLQDRGRAARPAGGGQIARGGDRRAADRLVHRAHVGQHRAPRRRGGRLRLCFRHL